MGFSASNAIISPVPTATRLVSLSGPGSLKILYCGFRNPRTGLGFTGLPNTRQTQYYWEKN
jgi:hypothetical protein